MMILNSTAIRTALASIALVFSSTGASAEESDAPLQHQEVTVTTSEGFRLNAFVSRPKGSTGPLPSLLLTQWVSCGSIAPREGRLSQAEQLALKADYALIRVDRAGEGKSEGPGCDKLDYETEVRHYREALGQLSEHPWVDAEKIVIFGSSLGSTTAPLVALNKPVVGVIVQGAGALTYFERMVRFDRIQLERQPNFNPLQIDQEMRKRIEFHGHYLHGKMTPDEIEAQHTHLAGVWDSLRGTDAKPHYGRPHAWHWQAAEQNWLAAWSQIESPVMVVYGAFEQFEGRHGHRTIVDTINRLKPGRATWLEIPNAGHGLGLYPDQYAAYGFSDPARAPELFITPVSQWLQAIAKGQPSGT